jgi:ELWxxDGT repeat protein
MTNPALVQDIFPGTSSSSPKDLTDVNGTLFFVAADGSSGNELWKSDGTSEGTVRVSDIRAGNAGSFPKELTDVNGTLFFTADDGSSGNELWKSDGTSEGTVRVSDIIPGASNSYPRNLTDVNSTLFFTTSDGSSGNELWKSDGTSEGTVRVSDINPGFRSSSPLWLTVFNGTLFFTADDGSSGNELWKSDGTSEGTVRVSDIRPGSAGSYPRDLTVFNGTLFFTADDGSSGYELWKSDGTSEGTVRVSDIIPGTASSSPRDLTDVNGMLFFSARDGSSGNELWKSDGTSEGTVRISDIRPGSAGSYPRNLTVINGTLFFTADDGSSGYELWKSDGTSEGTVLVRDVNPGASNSYPNDLTDVNGTLFFRADDGGSGNELWKSDGTSEGTVRISDIRPGSTGSSPLWLKPVNGTLFFSADDGSSGSELWRYTIGDFDVIDDNESISIAEDSTSNTGSLLLGTSSPDGPVFIVSFSIDGESGPFNLGSNYSISGIGDLTIAANGDYSFSPLTDFNGNVPRVRYTVSDGSGTDDTSTFDINVIAQSNSIDDGDAVFSITGTAVVGEILTASLDASDPDGDGPFSYLWESSSNGSNWTGIGNNSPSLLLTTDEADKQVRLTVSYTDGEGFNESVQALGSTVQSNSIDDGDAVFSITGTAVVGEILTASLDASDPDGDGPFSYLWESSSNGSNWTGIGNNSPSLLLTTDEADKQVRLTVSYTDGEGFNESVQALGSTVQSNSIDDGDAVFSITGTAVVGEILTASLDASDPDGDGPFSYLWESSSNGSNWTGIGNNSPSLLLTTDEADKQVRLTVSYTDGEGFNESVQALGSTVQSNSIDDGDAVFSITGTAVVGEILTASLDASDPDGDGPFSYLWESSSNGSNWSWHWQ